MVKNLPVMQETRVQSLGQEDPLEKKMVALTSILAQRIPFWGFPGGTSGKEPACQVGDSGSLPRSGSSPGEGNGNPLQYSCLENPMHRGAWQATVHGIARVGQNLVLSLFIVDTDAEAS